MAACAVLTRSIGVALGAGVVLYALVVRRDPWPRLAAIAAPVIVVALAWGAWVLVHRDDLDPALVANYGTYGDYLRQAGWSGLVTSLRDLPRPLAAISLGWLPSRALYLVFGAVALVIGLAGLFLLVRRSAIGFVLCCYLAVLAVWPFYPDRFLWAVLPWFALAWVAGLFALWTVQPLRIPLALAAAAVGIGYGWYQLRYPVRHITAFVTGTPAGPLPWVAEAGAVSANFEELLPAIGQLPPDAVLATDDEALVWLYTGRRAVPLYAFRYRGRETTDLSAVEHRAYLDRQGVSHIVLASAGSPSARQLRTLIAAYPDLLTPVHQWTGARWIYEVGRGR